MDFIQKSKPSFVKSVLNVSVGNIICLLAGLLSQMVVAMVFGAGKNLDAFLTASVIPTYIQSVLIAGLSFVLIPEFVKQTEKKNDQLAWAMVGTVLLTVLGILLIITVSGMVFSRSLVSLIAPGLSSEKAKITIEMLRIMMLTVPVAGIGSLTSGVQNARRSFFVPAIAPAFGSLVNIVVISFGHRVLGAESLAYGNLGSFIVQGIITAIPVLSHGFDRLMPLNDPIIVNLGKLSSPLILFGIFTRITPVFERFFASGLPDGELSYLGYAAKISALVVAVIASPVATVIFPEMAKSYAESGDQGLREVFTKGLVTGLWFGMPMIAILSIVRLPLVKVFFERGEFSPGASTKVSIIIPAVLLVALTHIIGNIASRAFYTTGNTVFVPFSASITSFLYIGAGFLFMSSVVLNYRFLAYAQAAQWAVLEIWLLVKLYRMKVVDTEKLWSSGKRILFATLVCSGVAYAVLWSLAGVSAIFQVAISGVAGVLCYGSMMAFLEPGAAIFIRKKVRELTVLRLE